MSRIEKGYGFKHVFSDFCRDISPSSVSAAIIAAVFAFTAFISLYPVCTSAGLSATVVDEWLCSTLFFGGLIGVLMGAYYRKPIAIAGSFAGCIIFLMYAVQHSLSEALLGAVMSGVLLIILAVTGLMKTVVRFLPTPVVMGMIGGCFLSYCLKIVSPLTSEPWIVVIMLVAYLVCWKIMPKVPAVLAAMIAGVIYLMFTGITIPVPEIAVILPHFQLPAITGNFFDVFISLGVPLTVLVLGAENAQAYGVLLEREYDPPINSMTFVSGLGGILSGFTGGCNINIAGPMTAICASPDAGKKDGRWTGSVLLGIIWMIVGPIFNSLTAFFAAFPITFVSIISGLALIGVLMGAMRSAFANAKHQYSAIFAFLVAYAGVKLFGISAPFWSLVIGVVIYILFEGGLKEDKTASESVNK